MMESHSVGRKAEGNRNSRKHNELTEGIIQGNASRDIWNGSDLNPLEDFQIFPRSGRPSKPLSSSFW